MSLRDTKSSFHIWLQRRSDSPLPPSHWAGLERPALTWLDQANTQMSLMSFLPHRHPPSASLGLLIRA